MSIPLPPEYVAAFASWTLLAAELDVDGNGLADARSTRGFVEFRPLEGGRETSVATVLHGRLLMQGLEVTARTLRDVAKVAGK